MGRFEAVQGNHPRVAVATERLTEEGFGGGDVAGAAKVGPNRFALFVDGAVKVKPLAAHLEVGLVHAPGIADRLLVGLPAFFELQGVAHDPSQDRTRGDRARRVPWPARPGLGS